MTFVATLIGRDSVCQSADNRVTAIATRTWTDAVAQKQSIVVRPGWAASISFAGVGSIGSFATWEWLDGVLQKLPATASWRDLLVELRNFQIFLRRLDSSTRRHSFVVAGFTGVHATLSIVSNFESFTDRSQRVASAQLSPQTRRVASAKLFLHGSGSDFVTLEDRRRLLALYARNAGREELEKALVDLNSRVSAQTTSVSPSCLVGFLGSDGKGSAKVFGRRQTKLSLHMPHSVRDSALEGELQNVLATHFPTGYQLVEQNYAQSPPCDEQSYLNQIRRHPNSAEFEMNYASLLLDQKRVDDALEHYKRAVEKEPENVTALTLFAEFLWRHFSDANKADEHFRKALAIRDPDALVATSYADFLRYVREDYPLALRYYQRAMELNKQVPQRALRLAYFFMNELGDLDAAEYWVSKTSHWGAPSEVVEEVQRELLQRKERNRHVD